MTQTMVAPATWWDITPELNSAPAAVRTLPCGMNNQAAQPATGRNAGAAAAHSTATSVGASRAAVTGAASAGKKEKLFGWIIGAVVGGFLLVPLLAESAPAGVGQPVAPTHSFSISNR